MLVKLFGCNGKLLLATKVKVQEQIGVCVREKKELCEPKAHSSNVELWFGVMSKQS